MSAASDTLQADDIGDEFFGIGKQERNGTE